MLNPKSTAILFSPMISTTYQKEKNKSHHKRGEARRKFRKMDYFASCNKDITVEQKKKCDVNREHSVKVLRPARCVIITVGDRSDSPAAASTIPGKIPRVCCIAQFASYVHHARSRIVASPRQSSAHSESC